VFLSKYANKVQRWTVHIYLVNSLSIGLRRSNSGQLMALITPFGDYISIVDLYICSLS